MTHRVVSRPHDALPHKKIETKKNYVVLKNPRQLNPRPNSNSSDKDAQGCKNIESLTYPNSARVDKPADGIQKPAIFTKNSVLESAME